MAVLVIEDSDVDFCLIKRAMGDQFVLVREVTLAEGLAAASRKPFDLVILDLTLEDCRGFETFEKAYASLSGVPILVLSGIDDDEFALRAVSCGAQDYIRKSRLLDYPLDRAARYAIERRRIDNAAIFAERQYRTLLDNLPIAAFTCNAEGLITYYNQKAVELWGRKPKLNDPSERYTGACNLFDADGTVIAREQTWMARSIREGTSFIGGEMIVERPSGERRTMLVDVNPIRNESGAVTGAIAVLNDITRQRHAEQELRESERFARAVVNSLDAQIAIIDQAGTIIAVNTAWQDFATANDCLSSTSFGVGSNYLRVCEAARCDGGKFAQDAPAGIRAVLDGRQSHFCLEYSIHSATAEHWFTMRVTPFDGEGTRRAVVSHEDITPGKVAERLTAEQRGLREAVTSMEQVLGVVGHELRTPLAALRAISEFLTTDGARNTAEADTFLHEITDEVDRMSDTVNNLLEAARLNSGRARWNWSQIDLNEIIEEAASSIRPLIDPTRVRIETLIEASNQPMLGDADAIRRLVINLLSNARKHTEKGRIAVNVRQFTDSNGRWADIIVSDSGCGIPPAMLARLGEAFALNSGVVGKNHVNGTGLGLAICKGIITAHGGQLLVDSTVGKGSTVTARLRVDLETAVTGDTVPLASPERVAA